MYYRALNGSRYKKRKVFPVHAMKRYGGSRGTAPLILNLFTRWRWVALSVMMIDVNYNKLERTWDEAIVS